MKTIRRKYPNLKIINPSKEVIHPIKKILKEKDGLAESSQVESVFYASDLSENFLNMIDTIFENTKATVKFKSFELEK